MMKSIRMLSQFLVICVFSSAAALMAAEHTKDSLDTVKEKLKEKSAILVDVREQDEWDDGHIQNARLVPLSKLKKDTDIASVTKGLPKDKIIYCHCASGKRCLSAADTLKKEGFDVRPLKPGYQALVEAGFPKVEKKDK